MGHIVQTMMTLTQLQKNKYECNSTYSSELDSSSSSSSNNEDKLSTNSIEDIEEQLQHTTNNNNNNRISSNIKSNHNKDIHSVSDNYIPAILPKRPWGEFSILHYTDTSSNVYSSLPTMFHSLDIRNNSYSTPNTPPSTASNTSPSYTIPPQESILSETDDDEDHQDYDDSNAMDDIIKMMEETHLNIDKNVPNLCKSPSSSSSSLSSSLIDNKNHKSRNISHPSLNKPSTSNSHTTVPISSNTSTIDESSNIKKDITNPSTFLPSDFQFSFNIEKNEPKNEQVDDSSFMVTRCASPLTLKNRKILPMPKSRIKRLNNENVSSEKTTSTITNKMNKPMFLKKERHYDSTTMTSINNNSNNNNERKNNDNNNNNNKSNSNNDKDKGIYKYEDDTIHDHTKKVKRTSHNINLSEKLNMNFNKTLNKEATITVNRSTQIPTSASPDNTKKKNKKKKKILPFSTTATTTATTANNNHNNNYGDNNNINNNNNNTLAPPLSSLSIQKKKNSKSGNNLPNIRQTLSTPTPRSTRNTNYHHPNNNNNNNTIPSSSTIPKNRINNKNKKRTTKTSSTLPEGYKRLRQQQQQQQQDPSAINLITPLDPTDWICLYCQYEIFMEGWIKTQKKKRLAQKRGSKKKKLKQAENDGDESENEN